MQPKYKGYKDVYYYLKYNLYGYFISLLKGLSLAMKVQMDKISLNWTFTKWKFLNRSQLGVMLNDKLC